MTHTYLSDNIYVPGLPRPVRLPEERPSGPFTRGSCRYTDAEVIKLPFIDRGHPHYLQWVPRQASWRRLVHYLADQKAAASILEVGCGNGWLSHQLASVPGSRVIGLDLNFMELQQAARVFRGQTNLKFIYGDFYSDVLQGLSFDIIVFAAVVHHFPSLSQVLKEALPYLRPRGEIHLLDSCLYAPDLAAFRHRYLFHPGSFWNRLILRKEIFPWVCVMDKTT